ncbi:XRE family transcriptional regulator [Ruminococcus sp.]|uniref:XRE family transcriptional regulator n=1 Tax=Ruminococcus sp. TaxID=41978 RepID=UPI0025E1048C|nr:XRE family transcriptional regulator [Ruminococcus sp.]MBQ8965884.1 XRE family transcriptional regulator [Ruminococcus sp.]
MYRNLEAELARAGIKRTKLAELLNVTASTISEKLNKSGRFTLKEAFLIRDTFFPSLTLDYLFEENAESA